MLEVVSARCERVDARLEDDNVYATLSVLELELYTICILTYFGSLYIQLLGRYIGCLDQESAQRVTCSH